MPSTDDATASRSTIVLLGIEQALADHVAAGVDAHAYACVTIAPDHVNQDAVWSQPVALVAVDLSSITANQEAILSEMDQACAAHNTPLVVMVDRAEMSKLEVLQNVADHLIKPCTPAALMAKVAEHITVVQTILLADDEPQILLLVGNRLKADGYQVMTAQDGQEALQTAKASRPDLIILDLMMPKLDGYNVCRMLKYDPKYANTPIVIFTAKTRNTDEQLGKDCGADAYIRKPFRPEELLSTVQSLLASANRM